MKKYLKKKKNKKLLVQLIISKSIRKYITMSKVSKSQEFRLKNIERTKNYLIKQIDQNELMSKKHKELCRVQNYIEDLLILRTCLWKCIHFALASLIGIHI